MAPKSKTYFVSVARCWIGKRWSTRVLVGTERPYPHDTIIGTYMTDATCADEATGIVMEFLARNHPLSMSVQEIDVEVK